MSLDPLGAPGEQLHLAFLFFFLLPEQFLDLLGLAALLLPVSPLLLQLFQLMVTLIKFLIAFRELLVMVIQLRVVGIQRLSVHLVRRFERGRQLSLLFAVGGSLSVQLSLELIYPLL